MSLFKLHSHDQRPDTIPALRAWTADTGSFELCRDSRIVVCSADERLMQCVALFAEEIEAMTGIRLSIVSGIPTPQTHDIRVEIGPTDAIESGEGYRLEIGRWITVRAPGVAGVFYGTRTMLQLLVGGTQVPAGIAIDWPRYPERTLMIDIARKSYTVPWLEQRIRDMAFLKMNRLHLHISDNEGFGIESCKVPVEKKGKLKRLSQHEVRHLIDLAHRYFITVIPEIDMPGHMGAVLSGDNAAYCFRDASGRCFPHVLNIGDDDAIDFAWRLVDEFITLFDEPSWHGGGDEIFPLRQPSRHRTADPNDGVAARHATSRYFGKDEIRLFMNRLHERVRQHGKTLRVWNDELNGGADVPLADDIIVHWWTQISLGSDLITVTPEQLLMTKHRIVNNGVWPTYYVLGTSPVLPNASMRAAYESWSVNQFDGYGRWPLSHTIDAAEPRNLGTGLSIWADHPEAEDECQVAENIADRLCVIAQKAWDSQLLTSSYDEFIRIVLKVGKEPFHRRRSGPFNDNPPFR